MKKTFSIFTVFVSLLLIQLAVPIPWASAQQVNASFVASRTGGIAPLTVLFDATDTTARGISRPFHDLLYEWDFGDSGAGVWSTDGKSKNRAIGGIAGHLFADPGLYNVRLTVTSPNGDQDVVTQQITVHDPNDPENGIGPLDTWCFANTGSPGGVGFADCPHNDAARQVVTGDYYDAVANLCDAGSSGKQCLFRRGDTFTASAGLSLFRSRGPGIIGSFGSGARPIVNGQGPGSGGNDWRVMDIVFVGNNASIQVNDMDSHGEIIDYVIYNVDVIDYPNCWDQFVSYKLNPARHNQVAFVDFYCKVNEATGTGWAAFGPMTRSMILGAVFENGGNTTEGTMRTTHFDHSVIQHAQFLRIDDPGCLRRRCKNSLSIRACGFVNAGDEACGPINSNPDEYIIVSDNFFEEKIAMAIRTCTHSGCENGGNTGTASENLIIERNFIKMLPNGDEELFSLAAISSQSGDITVRNNVVDYTSVASNINVRFFLTQSAGANFSNRNNVAVYNNTIFTDDSNTRQFRICESLIGTDNICRNNLLYAPNQVNKSGAIGSWREAGDNYIDVPSSPGPGEYVGFPFATAYRGATDSRQKDFYLSSSATALIDSGFDFRTTNLENVYLDAGEQTRPQGTGYDIGAFEFVSQ